MSNLYIKLTLIGLCAGTVFISLNEVNYKTLLSAVILSGLGFMAGVLSEIEGHK